MIHCLGQMLTCIRPLDSFVSASAYRKHIGRGAVFWHSIRSIKKGLIAMAKWYDPIPLPPPEASPVRDAIEQGEPIIISHPLGIKTHNAIVQTMGLTATGNTPTQNPSRWYSNSTNANIFYTLRKSTCIGCMVTPLVNKPKKNSTDPRIKEIRKRCSTCGKDEAHQYCAICHHYFHTNPKYLPETEQKLISIPTEKRSCDDEPLYMHVENHCFHVWHSTAQEEAWEGIRQGHLLEVGYSRFRGASQLSTVSEDTSGGDVPQSVV